MTYETRKAETRSLVLHAGTANLSERDRRVMARLALRQQAERGRVAMPNARVARMPPASRKVVATGGPGWIAGAVAVLAMAWAVSDVAMLTLNLIDLSACLVLNLLFSSAMAILAIVLAMSRTGRVVVNETAPASGRSTRMGFETAMWRLHKADRREGDVEQLAGPKRSARPREDGVSRPTLRAA